VDLEQYVHLEGMKEMARKIAVERHLFVSSGKAFDMEEVGYVAEHEFGVMSIELKDWVIQTSFVFHQFQE